MIKHISMADKVAFSIYSYMLTPIKNFDRTNLDIPYRPKKLIMIASNISHFGLLCYLDNLRYDLTVRLWPVPFLSQSPSINNISYENQMLTLDVRQKLIKLGGVATS
jgi:hypothetical protein